MKIEILLIIVVVIVMAAVVLLPWIIRTYNTLVMGRNRVKEIWANIEVQLNRRHELIPNLVNIVKGYAGHENTTLQKVTEARTMAVSARTPAEHATQENMLTQTLGSLFAVAESYPELKASGNFMDLQNELSDTENKIQEARTKYNKAVRMYNTFIQRFPTNMIAGMMGFKSEEFYDAPDAANEMKVEM